MDFFGIRLIGINAETGQKALLTLIAVLGIVLARRVVTAIALRTVRLRGDVLARFWTRQAISLGATAILILALLSIWFDDPTRLATALGLVTAGLAFALQRVVTAIAGYFVILRGNNFSIGDRIVMGGVRGDVVGIGLIQTTIMEMGQPPAVQGADPAVWVRSRQYTGRLVSVSNDKIFDEAIYNYTRDFPYLWEELTLPISYTADRERAERILLAVAQRHSGPLIEDARRALDALGRRYIVQTPSVEPRVYLRMTDNWLELSVRFVTEAHGVRDVKDAMSREILAELDAAGIGIASATFELVGLPPLRVQVQPGAGGDGRAMAEHDHDQES